MGEIILKTKIKREYGYLYPTGADENGFLIVYKVKAGRHKKEGSRGLETPKQAIKKQDYKETTDLKPKEQEHTDFKQEEQDIINWDE